MIVKSLQNTEFDIIIDCFLKSFKNYFVEMPTDIHYYKKRWKSVKVDFNLSYGMFENEKLIGFIINAINQQNGDETAFNTGSGVLPGHRGKRIIKSIYEYAILDLKNNGIKKCALEVITENFKAIKSYQSIGFEICKKFECYKGNINLKSTEKVESKKVNYNTFDWNNLPNQELYSWDNHSEIIKNSEYDYYQIVINNELEAYFVINQENGYLAQFEVLIDTKESWKRLFNGIKQISYTIRINNIEEKLKKKIEFIKSIGLENTVNQYEMEMTL